MRISAINTPSGFLFDFLSTVVFYEHCLTLPSNPRVIFEKISPRDIEILYILGKVIAYKIKSWTEYKNRRKHSLICARLVVTKLNIYKEKGNV